jgi:hypothetical protein
MLEAERILMVDLAATQLQAKGAAPSASCEGGQIEAAVAKPLNGLPPPFANGVHRLYHQLVETHVIIATQLAECAHWHQSNPTPNTAYARASWRGPTTVPSVTKMAPTPPTDFSPHASLSQWGQRVEHQAHR